MGPEDEIFQEYFKNRYDNLIKNENNSDLLNILTGVGPIESFSDTVTVLKMYDDAAENVIPGYWCMGLDKLNSFLRSKKQRTLPVMDFESQKEIRSFLNADPSKNSPTFEDYLNPNFFAKGQVNFLEGFFAGECISGFPDIKYL